MTEDGSQKSAKRWLLIENVGTQTASLDDALKGAHWNRFVAVHGDDYLPTIGVTPFLVTEAQIISFLLEFDLRSEKFSLNRFLRRRSSRESV